MTPAPSIAMMPVRGLAGSERNMFIVTCTPIGLLRGLGFCKELSQRLTAAEQQLHGITMQGDKGA